jgi:hypothetical protein
MSVPQRAQMVVSPIWLQVVLLTFLIGFAIAFTKTIGPCRAK